MKNILKWVGISITLLIIIVVNGYEYWEEFKRTDFEKHVYNGCLAEGKASKTHCSCYADHLDENLSEKGKIAILKGTGGESVVGFTAIMQAKADMLEFMPEMLVSTQFCEKNN